MLLWDIFDKDPANVQFAEVSKVLKMTVAGMEVQVKRSAAVLRLAMLEMFIHLVYVACRLIRQPRLKYHSLNVSFEPHFRPDVERKRVVRFFTWPSLQPPTVNGAGIC